jgi:hypothetical protein
MANNRLTRELESRKEVERPKQWAPAETQPEQDKQPGFANRWIRISTLDKADPRNLSGKLREGWEPVKVSEQPRFQLLIDPNSRFKDNVEIGGLLLCKTPQEFVDQRNKHFDNQTQAQTTAIDNSFMRESDVRMPLFAERKSSTSFGKG